MGDPALKKTIIVVVCVFVFFYLLTWGTSSVSNNNAAELGSQEEESENQEQLTEFEEGFLVYGLGEEEESQHATQAVAAIIILSVCVLAAHLIHTYELTFMPESVAVVFIGMLFGLVLRISHQDYENLVTLDPQLFFLFILPPIIFESAYLGVNKGDFFRHIVPIVVFALIGTVISAVIISSFLYVAGEMGIAYKMPFLDCFIYGSLTSAVDPVATLAIFKNLCVVPMLEMTVLGESIVNDAVSIVLMRTLVHFLSHPVESGLLQEAAGRFLLSVFGSAALGVGLGLISALALKYLSLRDNPTFESSFLYFFAYLPYVAADMLGMSGIMAVLFAGITMAHYTHHNMTPLNQIGVGQTLHTLAFLCETAVFAYLGIAIFTHEHHFDFGFILVTIVACLVGRVFNIYPLSFIMNLFRSEKIPAKMQFMMWFSGLRGAIAFALALNAPGHRSLIVTTTLVLVVFTMVVLGGSVLPLLKKLGLDKQEPDPETLNDDDDRHLVSNTQTAQTWFSQMDEKYLRGIFIAQKTPKHAKFAVTEVEKIVRLWDPQYHTIEMAEVDVDSPTEPRSMQEVPGVEEHHRFRIHNDNEIMSPPPAVLDESDVSDMSIVGTPIASPAINSEVDLGGTVMV